MYADAIGHVGFGSSTEVRNGVLDVGFTPKNRHYVAGGACPFRASNGRSALVPAQRSLGYSVEPEAKS